MGANKGVEKTSAKKVAKSRVTKKKSVVKKKVTKKKTSAKKVAKTGKNGVSKRGKRGNKEKVSIKETGVHFVKVSGVTEEEKIDVVLTKNERTGKSLGFCYFCHKAVADFDLISTKKYNCIGCGKDGLVNKLKKKNPDSKQWESKREYLSSTVFGGSTYIPSISHSQNVSNLDNDSKEEKEEKEDEE